MICIMKCRLFVLLLSMSIAAPRHVSACQHYCAKPRIVSVTNANWISVNPQCNNMSLPNDLCKSHSGNCAVLARLCAIHRWPISATLPCPAPSNTLFLPRTAWISPLCMRRTRMFCQKTSSSCSRNRNRCQRQSLLRIQSAQFNLQELELDALPRPAPRSGRLRGSPPLFDHAALDVTEKARRTANRQARHQGAAPDPAPASQPDPGVTPTAAPVAGAAQPAGSKPVENVEAPLGTQLYLNKILANTPLDTADKAGSDHFRLVLLELTPQVHNHSVLLSKVSIAELYTKYCDPGDFNKCFINFQLFNTDKNHGTDDEPLLYCVWNENLGKLFQERVVPAVPPTEGVAQVDNRTHASYWESILNGGQLFQYVDSPVIKSFRQPISGFSEYFKHLADRSEIEFNVIHKFQNFICLKEDDNIYTVFRKFAEQVTGKLARDNAYEMVRELLLYTQVLPAYINTKRELGRTCRQEIDKFSRMCVELSDVSLDLQIYQVEAEVASKKVSEVTSARKALLDMCEQFMHLSLASVAKNNFPATPDGEVEALGEKCLKLWDVNPSHRQKFEDLLEASKDDNHEHLIYANDAVISMPDLPEVARNAWTEAQQSIAAMGPILGKYCAGAGRAGRQQPQQQPPPGPPPQQQARHSTNPRVSQITSRANQLAKDAMSAVCSVLGIFKKSIGECTVPPLDPEYPCACRACAARPTAAILQATLKSRQSRVDAMIRKLEAAQDDDIYPMKPHPRSPYADTLVIEMLYESQEVLARLFEKGEEAKAKKKEDIKAKRLAFAGMELMLLEKPEQVYDWAFQLAQIRPKYETLIGLLNAIKKSVKIKAAASLIANMTHPQQAESAIVKMYSNPIVCDAILIAPFSALKLPKTEQNMALIVSNANTILTMMSKVKHFRIEQGITSTILAHMESAVLPLGSTSALAYYEEVQHKQAALHALTHAGDLTGIDQMTAAVRETVSFLNTETALKLFEEYIEMKLPTWNMMLSRITLSGKLSTASNPSPTAASQQQHSSGAAGAGQLVLMTRNKQQPRRPQPPRPATGAAAPSRGRPGKQAMPLRQCVISTCKETHPLACLAFCEWWRLQPKEVQKKIVADAKYCPRCLVPARECARRPGGCVVKKCTNKDCPEPDPTSHCKWLCSVPVKPRVRKQYLSCREDDLEDQQDDEYDGPGDSSRWSAAELHHLANLHIGDNGQLVESDDDELYDDAEEAQESDSITQQDVGAGGQGPAAPDIPGKMPALQSFFLKPAQQYGYYASPQYTATFHPPTKTSNSQAKSTSTTLAMAALTLAAQSDSTAAEPCTDIDAHTACLLAGQVRALRPEPEPPPGLYTNTDCHEISNPVIPEPPAGYVNITRESHPEVFEEILSDAVWLHKYAGYLNSCAIPVDVLCSRYTPVGDDLEPDLDIHPVLKQPTLKVVSILDNGADSCMETRRLNNITSGKFLHSENVSIQTVSGLVDKDFDHHKECLITAQGEAINIATKVVEGDSIGRQRPPALLVQQLISELYGMPIEDFKFCDGPISLLLSIQQSSCLSRIQDDYRLPHSPDSTLATSKLSEGFVWFGVLGVDPALVDQNWPNHFLLKAGTIYRPLRTSPSPRLLNIMIELQHFNPGRRYKKASSSPSSVSNQAGVKKAKYRRKRKRYVDKKRAQTVYFAQDERFTQRDYDLFEKLLHSEVKHSDLGTPLCAQHSTISDNCQACSIIQAKDSAERIMEYEIIKKRMKAVPVPGKPGKFRLTTDLLYNVDPKIFGDPRYSNYKRALAASLRIWRKLVQDTLNAGKNEKGEWKVDFVKIINDEWEKACDSGHYILLSAEEFKSLKDSLHSFTSFGEIRTCSQPCTINVNNVNFLNNVYVNKIFFPEIVIFPAVLAYNSNSLSTPARLWYHSNISAAFRRVTQLSHVNRSDIIEWPLSNDTAQRLLPRPGLAPGSSLSKIQAPGVNLLNSLRRSLLRFLVFETQVVSDISKVLDCKLILTHNPTTTVLLQCYRSFLVSHLDSMLRCRVWFKNATTAAGTEELVPVVARTAVLVRNKMRSSGAVSNCVSCQDYGDTQAPVSTHITSSALCSSLVVIWVNMQPILEAGCREHVLPAALLQETKRLVEEGRYVVCIDNIKFDFTDLINPSQDNIAGSFHVRLLPGRPDFIKVEKICDDLVASMGKFSLHCKYIKVTKGVSDKYDNKLTDDGFDHCDQFYGLVVDLAKKTICPNFSLSLFKKQKGQATGPDLQHMSQEDIESAFPDGITRRQAVRLNMSAFNLLSRELGVAHATAKELARKVTDLGLEWDQPIRDKSVELEKEILQFYGKLADHKSWLDPFQSYCCPDGSHPIAIIASKDGGQNQVGTTIHILSEMEDHIWDLYKKKKITYKQADRYTTYLLLTKSKLIRGKTVPQMESGAFKLCLMVLTEVVDFLDFLLDDFCLDIFVQNDSACISHLFDKNRLPTITCTFMRNCIAGSKHAALNITERFPGRTRSDGKLVGRVRFFFTLVAGADTVSDWVSKQHSNWPEMQNSEKYRKGPQFYCDLEKLKERVFWMCEAGKETFFPPQVKPNKSDGETCKIPPAANFSPPDKQDFTSL